MFPIWNFSKFERFPRDGLLFLFFGNAKSLQHLGCQKVTMVISSKRCLLGWAKCPGGHFAVHIRLRRSPTGFAEFASCSQSPPKHCSCFMRTDVQGLRGVRSWRVPQLALSPCTVRSLQSQSGFPFPLCSIIQSSTFGPMAMFSHISECSLWRSGDVFSQSCQSLQARRVKPSTILPHQHRETIFLLITVKFNFTPFHSLFKDVLFQGI